VNDRDGQFYCAMDRKLLVWHSEETELDNAKTFKVCSFSQL